MKQSHERIQKIGYQITGQRTCTRRLDHIKPIRFSFYINQKDQYGKNRNTDADTNTNPGWRCLYFRDTSERPDQETEDRHNNRSKRHPDKKSTFIIVEAFIN